MSIENPYPALKQDAQKKDLFSTEVEITIEGTTYRPGWYFADEIYQLLGPYPTRQEAEQALKEYIP